MIPVGRGLAPTEIKLRKQRRREITPRPTGDRYVFCHLPCDGCKMDSRGRLSLQLIWVFPSSPSLGGFVFFRRKRQTILSIPCRGGYHPPANRGRNKGICMSPFLEGVITIGRGLAPAEIDDRETKAAGVNPRPTRIHIIG